MSGVLEILGGWGIPLSILIVAGIIFGICQIIGAIMDAYGKTAPVIMIVKKYFMEL